MEIPSNVFADSVCQCLLRNIIIAYTLHIYLESQIEAICLNLKRQKLGKYQQKSCHFMHLDMTKNDFSARKVDIYDNENYFIGLSTFNNITYFNFKPLNEASADLCSESKQNWAKNV